MVNNGLDDWNAGGPTVDSSCLNVIEDWKKSCEDSSRIRPGVKVSPGVLQVISSVAACEASEYVRRRLVTKIMCPIDDCFQKLKDWLCGTCRSQVKFTLGGSCVCKCGQYPLRGTEVRCNSAKHVFRQRMASSVADELYNIAVFSDDETLSKNFIDEVTGGVGAVRNKQQVINFFDVEKHIEQVRKIHLVCLVIPQRSEGDEEQLLSLIRSKLIEIKILIGQQSLKNVIVCSEQNLLDELCVDADKLEFRILDLSEDLIIPTYRYGSSDDIERLVRIIGGQKPVMNFDAACRGSSDKMAELAGNLAHICGILSCAIEFKLKASKSGSNKNFLVYTHSTRDSKTIHELASLDAVNLEGDKNPAWKCDILLSDSEVGDSDSVLESELADLQDYKKRLINNVKNASSVMEQRHELASICAFLVEFRYCEEIAEYLDVVEEAKKQPVHIATVETVNYATDVNTIVDMVADVVSEVADISSTTTNAGDHTIDSSCLNVIEDWKKSCEDSSRIRPGVKVSPGVLQVISSVAACEASEYVRRRLVTKIMCPIDDCFQKLKDWLCGTCRSQVKFTLGGSCVCKCGQYPLRGTEVRCNSAKHVFRQRVASSVADELYNIAVFSNDETLSKNFIDEVTGGVGAVRNKQQVINFFDVEKDIAQVRKIQLVCLVIPQRSEGDEEHLLSLIRSKLIEIKFLIGQQSLKNVIVCSEQNLLDELCVDADDLEFRILDLSEDLIIPTYRYGSSDDIERLVRIIGGQKPVMNFDAACRGSSDKMAELAGNLAHICGILSCAIEFKLKASKCGSNKNFLVYTHSTRDSKTIHELASLDAVNLEGDKNPAWKCDILLSDSEVGDSDSVLESELADLQDYKKRLINKVKNASTLMEQRRELASICTYLVEGRYCQEIAEYLDVVEDDRTQ